MFCLVGGVLLLSLLGKWEWEKAGGRDRQILRVVVIEVPWQKELSSHSLKKGDSLEQCGIRIYFPCPQTSDGYLVK